MRPAPGGHPVAPSSPLPLSPSPSSWRKNARKRVGLPGSGRTSRSQPPDLFDLLALWKYTCRLVPKFLGGPGHQDSQTSSGGLCAAILSSALLPPLPARSAQKVCPEILFRFLFCETFRQQYSVFREETAASRLCLPFERNLPVRQILGQSPGLFNSSLV